MRAEDLETVRLAYDAFAAGDFEKLRTFLAPDIEWRTTPEVPFMGNYVGLNRVPARDGRVDKACLRK